MHPSDLQNKHHRLSQLLTPYAQIPIECYPSPNQHYRQRAEFRIWHNDSGAHYVMVSQGQKAQSDSIIYTPQFPPAAELINRLMPPLIDAINQTPILKHKLFQIDFLTTLTGESLITLLYHRQLDNLWQQSAHTLAQRLNSHIIGRARKQKIVLTQDYVQETYRVLEQEYHYRQYEGSFSQPNGYICQIMLNWAAQHCQHSQGDLLELYCGNGNFTLPLSRHFNKTLATEISKTSIKALKENIALNHIDNLKIARLSAEEFSQAWQGTRPFRRLIEADIHLNDYQFSTILVDPPRAGIDPDTLQLMQQFDSILYISCNPYTLADNLTTLCQTHQIQHIALFDQFPNTEHMEVGTLLKKR
ncbi:tRNA (uridine(54)-C5)-methyltransferase TrmA [Rappaport israeli]|uniref:tRNA (uridine(54)-C5)-methyltransferase TrmA n=1 Tax=Rappaport israeli TaxID=1839807 RepID=UPI0009316931|nr:tRNA (uridine(54)-C5)-methyltransferase TrmA [Rappaport israeli]